MDGPRRILVVDDQKDIRDLTVSVLAGAGYRAESVPSGDDALARLGADPFHLVLLDIDMPGMDGWETLRLIRADPELAGLSVVMFSIKSKLNDQVVSLQEGALDHIPKPFEVDELIRRVERALDSAQTAGR